MDGTQLGKKLKEARLAKKMTQSDVVGTFITRNMLSQIESGTASPSLRTLEYLATTLEIPIHYLIEKENLVEDSVNYYSSSTYLDCKNAYIRGDYSYVTDHTDELKDNASPYYDEGVALLARTYLKLAKLENDSNKPNKKQTTIDYVKAAATYGEFGIHASFEVKTEAMILLERICEPEEAFEISKTIKEAKEQLTVDS